MRRIDLRSQSKNRQAPNSTMNIPPFPKQKKLDEMPNICSTASIVPESQGCVYTPQKTAHWLLSEHGREISPATFFGFFADLATNWSIDFRKGGLNNELL